MASVVLSIVLKLHEDMKSRLCQNGLRLCFGEEENSRGAQVANKAHLGLTAVWNQWWKEELSALILNHQLSEYGVVY